MSAGARPAVVALEWMKHHRVARSGSVPTLARPRNRRMLMEPHRVAAAAVLGSADPVALLLRLAWPWARAEASGTEPPNPGPLREIGWERAGRPFACAEQIRLAEPEQEGFGSDHRRLMRAPAHLAQADHDHLCERERGITLRKRSLGRRGRTSPGATTLLAHVSAVMPRLDDASIKSRRLPLASESATYPMARISTVGTDSSTSIPLLRVRLGLCKGSVAMHHREPWIWR